MGLAIVMELREIVNEAGVWRIGRTYLSSDCEMLSPGLELKALEGGDCEISIVEMEYVKGRLVK